MARRRGRDFIARHGETVFNAAGAAAGRGAAHAADARRFRAGRRDGPGAARRAGARTGADLWASPTGRALQTLAVIAEHLELDWHAARTDPRLIEIGMGDWGGRYYADVAAEGAP